jgi:signal transduction histidine kinase
MVQEGERRRIARELHDEVGQTLTGVMLQVEGLAAAIPDELREQLDELRETARLGTEDVRRIARRLRPEATELRRKRSRTWRDMPRQSTRTSASTTGGGMPC